MSLIESARKWILENLPYDKADSTLVSYLEQQDAPTLLIIYHNWMSRLVHPKPRKIIESKAFQKNPILLERANDLQKIKSDIKNGDNLTKYLSRLTRDAVVKLPESRSRTDLDVMLNNWGVHHLHISSEIEADGFVKRGDSLLFVVFNDDCAYFIDIFGHKDFHKDRVLEILATEWPDEGLIHEVKGLVGVSPNYTEEERIKLRKKHVGVLSDIRGKFYFPSKGTTMSGHSIVSVRQADILIARIRYFEDTISKNPDAFKEDFQASGIPYPEKPVFEFQITEEGPVIIEIKSSAIMKGVL